MGDQPGELDALQRLALVDQHDRRVWIRLLELLVKMGKYGDAVKIGESAIYVDVMNPRVHRLYAKALAHTGKQVSAIFELNSAVLAEPEPANKAELYEALAKGYDKLKEPEMAKKARDYAKLVTPMKPKAKDDDDDDDGKVNRPPG
jgi:cellulose synthase operon protein C